jgi:hypothetical protein
LGYADGVLRWLYEERVTAASRHFARTVFLWLSLAIVLTCAVGSFGSPLRATSGSAFNAFTSDVSLGPSRAAEPDKERREQLPAPGGAGQAKAATAFALVVTAAAPRAASLHFDTIPAPAVLTTAGAVGARAPPRR